MERQHLLSSFTSASAVDRGGRFTLLVARLVHGVAEASSFILHVRVGDVYIAVSMLVSVNVRYIAILAVSKV